MNALAFYLEKEEELLIPKDCILRLSELVLTLNCFEFDGEYYSQISGTMMGSPFSVNYACLAMSYQEHKIEESYPGVKPVLYLRYIDDVIGISSMEREDLQSFIDFVNEFNPALEYTSDIGKEVHFLDATLKVDGTTIKSTLYSKPTDSHGYLRYQSCHPKSCKQSIPYAQFIRLRKLCSDDQDFTKKSKEMGAHFVVQGYPRGLVERKRRKVERMQRKELLKAKKKEDENKDRIVLPINFHPINKEVVDVVKDNFKTLQRDDEVGELFQDTPMVAYRRERNLKDMLVHSRIRSTNRVVGTYRCGRSRCLTCNYVCADANIVGPQGSYHVSTRFDCKSSGLIYCIQCEKCGDLYIGETGRTLAERFREHRQDVIQNREGREVASHFNSEGHSGIEDMKVMGVKMETSLIMRKFHEQKIIAKLGCYLGRGMNTDFRYMALTRE